MKKGFLVIGLGVLFYAATFGIAAATTIDLNALDGKTSIFLEAGTYTVTPVDNTDEGGYLAWSAWAEDVKTEEWLSYYFIQYDIAAATNEAIASAGNSTTIYLADTDSDSDNDLIIFRSEAEPYGTYKTASAAFDGASAITFTITKATDVFIDFHDNESLKDNRGGMSFDISAVTPAPVPEPATMLLLGCGLIGLVGSARKKLKK